MDALGLIALSGGGSSGGGSNSGIKLELVYEQDGFGHDTYSFNLSNYDGAIVLCNETSGTPKGYEYSYVFFKPNTEYIELLLGVMNLSYYKYRKGAFNSNGTLYFGNGKYREISNWSTEISSDKRVVNIVKVYGIKL